MGTTSHARSPPQVARPGDADRSLEPVESVVVGLPSLHDMVP